MRKITICFVAMLLILSHVTAQKINIGYICLAGAQRGSSTTIAIGGQSISTAKSVIVSGEGVTAEILPASPADAKGNKRKKGAISDEDNLQLAQNIKVKITVDGDAKLGIRDLKVIGATGIISNILYFEIGDYPDFVESEPNNSFAEANNITNLPVTINGYVEKSSVLGDMEAKGGGLTIERAGKDIFSFEAKEGEVIVAEVKARRFVPYLADAVPGWFQSVISIYDASGREVAYCDDYMFNIDPVIMYEVEHSGSYYIKIHDSIYRGREDFVYRINLGVIPFVSSIYPLGGAATKNSDVEIRGVNIGGARVGDGVEESLNTKMNFSKLDAGTHAIRYIDKKSKLASNEFLYNISDTQTNRTVADGENSSGRESAIELKLDETINAKIERVGDEDWYFFDAQKSDKYIIQLLGRKLQSPIDAKLTIYNPNGKKVKEIDDVVDPSQGLLTHHADPEIALTTPLSGRYYIRINETQNHGGDNYAYQLRLIDYKPDYILSIDPSSLSIPQGGTSIMTLFAQRKHKFTGKINLEFEGLPPGFEVSATEYSGNAKSMKIAITAPIDAELGRVNLKVLGVSQIDNGEPVIKEAKPSQVMTQAFYIQHLLSTDEFRVDVTEADPFTLSLEPMEGDVIQLKRNGFTPIRVVAHRKEGFNDEIQIMKKILPQGIYFSSVAIPAGESEAILQVECPYWNLKQKSNKIMVLGTVNGSTNNRVAGQIRNTINAAIMVNSPYTNIMLPTTGDPVSQEEMRRLSKLKK